MERIQNQTHTTETFLYASSRLLERLAYYGVRSLIVLYMISESMNMTRKEALTVYGWFTASILFSKIFGAILGDLLIGNKKAIIIGGLIQAVGAFVFCIPSTFGLYLGLFLITIGSGFYGPNILSQFGKLYLNKAKLLDSGFTILYLAVNIGALTSGLLIGFLGEKYGWNVGFITAGMFSLVSVAIMLFTGVNDKFLDKPIDFSFRNGLEKILIAIALVGLFWSVYELNYLSLLDIKERFSSSSTINLSRGVLNSLDTVFTFPITIVAIILWSFYYSNQFVKLTIGFFLGAFSILLLFFIPDTPTYSSVILYLVSALLLSISEIHIGPVAYSILTKNANPKYLAILISLSMAPIYLFNLVLSWFGDDLYNDPYLILKVSVTVMLIVSVGLVYYVFIGKKKVK